MAEAIHANYSGDIQSSLFTSVFAKGSAMIIKIALHQSGDRHRSDLNEHVDFGIYAAVTAQRDISL